MAKWSRLVSLSLSTGKQASYSVEPMQVGIVDRIIIQALLWETWTLNMDPLFFQRYIYVFIDIHLDSYCCSCMGMRATTAHVLQRLLLKSRCSYPKP